MKKHLENAISSSARLPVNCAGPQIAYRSRAASSSACVIGDNKYWMILVRRS